MFDFLQSLFDGLSSVAGVIEQAIAYLFSILVSVFEFIWAVLQLVFGYFLTLMQDIGNFFAHIWDKFFKGIFSDILKGVVKFGGWLHNIFAPVVKYLREAAKWIDRIYRHYAVPILRIIRIARVFLTLLKALGVKWAGKLDKILGTIQSDIQRAFLTIRGYLNVLIDLANILADPTMLLRRPTTLLSILRVSRAAIRMFTGLPPGFFVPNPSPHAPLGLGFLPANFDRNNPLHNPPASYYLAFDGGAGDWSGLDPGATIPDDSPDGVPPFEYFTDTAWPDNTCVDAASCQAEAARLALQGA